MYLVVVSLTALTVPAARDAFDHLLPLSGAAREAADRGRESGVARLPTHGLHLREKRGEKKESDESYCISGGATTGSHLLELTLASL